MVKLMLVVDNGPLKPQKPAVEELVVAYVNWCWAMWGLHKR